MILACPACGAREATGPTYPACCACGNPWSAAEPAGIPRVSPIERPPIPVWEDPVEEALLWKREDLNPTGSFKDRGAEALLGVAREAGASALVLDSSGSAALAAARVAARERLPITLHVPGVVGKGKLAALRSMGAKVVAGGSRDDAARRAARDAGAAFWFSHVYHPAFFEGTAESGREVLDRLGAETPPAWIVPVGNGSLLLGLDLALTRARRSGIALIAVQAANCSGLLPPSRPGITAAAGIAIPDPPRRHEILARIASREGEVLAVAESEIEDAWRLLARRGVIAEPASAAALAGVRRLRGRGDRRPLLAFLTGSGSRD